MGLHKQMYLLAERVAAEKRGKLVRGLVRGSNTSGQPS